MEYTVSNTASTATQSAINGESFSDAMEGMAKNIVIGAVSNMGAQAIGNAVHGNTDGDNYVLNQDGDRASIAGVEYQQIGKAKQLALHAALGCASGAAGGGGDCTSGAVSGVVGEMVGENLRPSVESGSMDRQTAIQVAGLAGGYSTIFTGNAVGLDDSEIAQNMYSGQRIGSNAAQNNAFNPWGITDNPYDEKFEEKKENLNRFAKNVNQDIVVARENTLVAPVYRGLSSANDHGEFSKYGEPKTIEINGKDTGNPYYFNDQSHEYAAEAWGSYVDNEFVAGTLRTIAEYAIQVPQYSATYDQHHPENYKYDPLGSYDPSKGGREPRPNDRGELMTGVGYWHDATDDIQNSINGANQNFNYIQDKQQYAQLFNQWQNERDN